MAMKTASKTAGLLLGQHVFHLVVETVILTPIKLDAGAISFIRSARGKTIGGDAEMQHAARKRASIANFHPMAETGRGDRRRTVRSGLRPRSGSGLPDGGCIDRHRPILLGSKVAEKTLDRMNAHGTVEIIAVASGIRKGDSRPGHARRAWGLSRISASQAARKFPACAKSSQACIFSPAGQAWLHGGNKST